MISSDGLGKKGRQKKKKEIGKWYSFNGTKNKMTSVPKFNFFTMEQKQKYFYVGIVMKR